MQKRMKKIIAAIGITIGVLIIVAVAINFPKTAKVDILVSPRSAKVTLNGKKYSSGIHRIEPGTYILEIKKDGFEDVQAEIDIEKEDVKKIYYCLIAEKENYYEDNEVDAEICDRIEESNGLDHDSMVLSADPIQKLIPYHSYEKKFFIDKENDSVTVLKITLLSCIEERRNGLKENALEWLRENGIDPNNYTIEYKNGCEED